MKFSGHTGTARAWNESGLAVLFCGPPGTGKTMAAEPLANELALDLYRIDFSPVVNKYIGETEKNLKRVFDATKASDCILFFDEADALFGKRTEVKDTHDRFANTEISYPVGTDGAIQESHHSSPPTGARTWMRPSCTGCTISSSSRSSVWRSASGSGARAFRPMSMHASGFEYSGQSSAIIVSD